MTLDAEALTGDEQRALLFDQLLAQVLGAHRYVAVEEAHAGCSWPDPRDLGLIPEPLIDFPEVVAYDPIACARDAGDPGASRTTSIITPMRLRRMRWKSG